MVPSALLARSTGLESDSEGGSSLIVAGNTADSERLGAQPPGPSGASADPTVTLSHDLIEKRLEEARSAWIRSGDGNALRHALFDLLRQIEGLGR